VRPSARPVREADHTTNVDKYTLDRDHDERARQLPTLVEKVRLFCDMVKEPLASAWATVSADKRRVP